MTSEDGARPGFPALPAVADLSAIEHTVLARWRDGNVFRRSLEQTADGPLWTFYEGPPTANGMPTPIVPNGPELRRWPGSKVGIDWRPKFRVS